MKKSENTTAKKKRSPWKTLLTVMLTSLGVLVLALGTFVTIFYIEDSKPVCWKSGEVIINWQPVTLPCSVEEFEAALEITIPEPDPIVKISKVTMDGLGGPISFNAHLSEDFSRVTGIAAHADSIGDLDGIIFPGKVTFNSNIEDVIELYSTKPLNIYHSYWSEEIVFSDKISAGYRYVDHSSFQIEVSTLDGIIDDICYFYIAAE